VAAARGHEVTLFEAAARPGGQIRLTARSARRREMLGIVDWRMARLEAAGVAFRFGTWAEAGDVTALEPDVVIVATGGYPDTSVIAGAELAVSAWDILSGDVAPGSDVLIYDEAGDHAGLQAAEAIAAAGGAVEIMTPDRTIAPEVMGMNLTPYMRSLQKAGAVFTVAQRPRAVRRDGNRLAVAIDSDYGPLGLERVFDQVVVNAGTLPIAELYFDLKPDSRNLGRVDHAALIAGRAQALAPNPAGRFDLYRIGDAVAARNTHAAIYDALRLLKDI